MGVDDETTKLVGTGDLWVQKLIYDWDAFLDGIEPSTLKHFLNNLLHSNNPPFTLLIIKFVSCLDILKG